jgi:hypothetical protein
MGKDCLLTLDFLKAMPKAALGQNSLHKMIHREKRRCHHRQALFQLQNYADCGSIEGILQKMK